MYSYINIFLLSMKWLLCGQFWWEILIQKSWIFCKWIILCAVYFAGVIIQCTSSSRCRGAARCSLPLPVMDCTTPGKSPPNEHTLMRGHARQHHRHHRVLRDFLGILPNFPSPVQRGVRQAGFRIPRIPKGFETTSKGSFERLGAIEKFLAMQLQFRPPPAQYANVWVRIGTNRPYWFCSPVPNLSQPLILMEPWRFL